MDIKSLHFSYGNQPFLKELTTTIAKGKITTILGPNGSGKSTLLNLLVNQLKPEKGCITIDGVSLHQLSVKEIARRMAIVYQQNTAPEDLTVKRLIRFGRTPYQGFFSSREEEEEEIIAWALRVTKLENMAEKRVGELSGGERQRAWIAMALAQKTDILFLDEPTTYLDIYYQLEILQLIKTLNQEYNITIVMVLHDINQAIQFSDQLLIMKQGQLLYQGVTQEAITEERLQEVYGIKAKLRWCERNQCHYMIPMVSA